MNDTNRNQWNAEDYAKNSTAQLEWANELIAKLQLQGNEALLDIGCGDGKVTHALAKELPNGKVLGIDASANMIELAFQSYQRDNLSFQVMDATVLNLEEKFDVAFSNAVLHWIKDHFSVLRRLKTHLNPGGRILFQMGGQGNILNMHEVVTALTKSDKWSTYYKGFEYPYSFYHPSDYERWLPEAGFEMKRAELIPKDMVHANPDALKGWLRTTWFLYTDRLPESLRETFLDEVVETFLAKYPLDAQGRTHVNMVRLEVEAIVL
ncbi:methyltransferase domain-containing protein [candidate division KSB1 bacterium]|nr:methyltransferase domain-containing protein [candidate division KSB1 bacterium]